MKIGLYISSLMLGGAERVVSRLSSILSSHGIDVVVITSYTTKKSYTCDGKLISMDCPPSSGVKKISTFLKRTKKLRQIRKEERFDYVISFLDSPNMANTLTRSCPGISVVSIRNYDSFDGTSLSARVKRSVFKYVYGKADCVIACSAEIKNTIVEKLGICPDRVEVLYNPFDRDVLIDAAAKTCIDEYVSFAKSHYLSLVTTGRMMHQKGYWHLVKILYGIKSRGIDVGLLLIGDGTQKSEIEKLASKLGVKDNIKFCGFQENPMAIESLANAYIMTSLYEGFPNALVEAMTIGLPLITADCKSGPSEIVTNERERIAPYECDQGLLLPVLESTEDWGIALSPTEKIWVDAITSMSLERLASKRAACIERSRKFGYDECYSTLMRILNGIAK